MSRRQTVKSSFTSYSIRTKGTLLAGNIVQTSETHTSGIQDESTQMYYEDAASLKETSSSTREKNPSNVEITEITTPPIDARQFHYDQLPDLHSELLDNDKDRIAIRPVKGRPKAMTHAEVEMLREATLQELIETEEEFVFELKHIITNYYEKLVESCICSESDLVEARDIVFSNLKEIYEFHDGVLLEGLKYYAKEPKMIGRTFVRLERDFDKHVRYCRDEPLAQDFLKDNEEVEEFFEKTTANLKDTKTISEHLKLPIQRLNDYQILLRDLINYTDDSKDLTRALELIETIPSKTTDLKFLNSIEGYSNIQSLGKVLKHDWFSSSSSGKKTERYLFLFKNKILVTKVRRVSEQRSVFILKDVLKVPEVIATKDNLKLTLKEGDKLYELENEGQSGNWKLELDRLIPVKQSRESTLSRSFEEIDDSTSESVRNKSEETIVSENKGRGGQVESSLSEQVKGSETGKAKATLEEETGTQLPEPNKQEPPNLNETTKLELKAEAKRDNLKEEQSKQNQSAKLNSGKSEAKQIKLGEELESGKTKLKETALKREETEQILKPEEPSPKLNEPKTTAESKRDNLKEERKPTEANPPKKKETKVEIIEVKPIKLKDYTLEEEKSDKQSVKPKEVKMSGRRKSSSGNIILVRRDSDNGNNTKPKPVLIEPLKSIECEPGDTATFSTTITSKTPLIITWLKDNRPLDDKLAERFKITSREDNYKLIILNTRNDDTGLYTIKSVNEFGNCITSSAQLTVHELTKEERQSKQQLNLPYFNVKFQDSQLLLDTTVCLMVDVKGEDVHLEFYKDNTKINFNEHIQLEKNIYFDLKIHNIEESDGGVYKCVAKNKYGQAEFESKISVTNEKDLFKSLEGKRLLEPGEEPDFNWYRDGKLFEPEERFKVMFKDEEDSLALVFQHVKPEDAGLYTCVASTSSGKISCSAELTVLGAIHQLLKEPAPPSLISALSDVEASTGSTAMFELSFSGFPKPSIVWSHGSKIINTSSDPKYKELHEDDDSATLIIKNVKVEDMGNYSAFISNDLGEVRTEAKLIVHSAPYFKTKLSGTIYGLESSLFEIVADCEGSPKPSVVWYKDGQELKQNANIKQEGSKIIMGSLAKELGGNWSIIATNEFGQMAQFFTLVVNSVPKITKGLEAVVKNVGEEVEFTVEVEGLNGSEGEQVVWKRDSAELTPSKTTLIEKLSQKEYKLKLKDLSRDSSAKITCQVQNNYGQDSTHSDLTINRQPKIIKKLVDLNIKDSGEACFDIKVDAFPKAKVKWYLDGIEIDSKRYGEEAGGIHKLKLPEADVTGKIIVKVENEFGRDEDSAMLNVLCKPSFLKGLQDVRVLQDTQLDLCVVVKGNPSPTISWFHNGNEVTTDARIKITKEATETYHCTFNVTLPSDNGEWEVKAKNEFGESSSKCIVTVEGKPIFEKKLKDVIEVIETESLVVDVAVGGEPKPILKWYLNSSEITRSEHTQITVNDVKQILQSELVIKNIELVEEEQELKCVASNKYGEVETKGKLRIVPLADLKKPKIIGGLDDMVIKKGESAMLKVEVKGNPTSVKWFKDGKEVKGVRDKDGLYCLPISGDCGGVYRVEASNEFGGDQAEATITLHHPPEIHGLKDINIIPGDTGHFQCEINANPPLTSVKWFSSDGTEMSGTIDNNIYSLELTPTDNSFEGGYTVKAANPLGESTASGRLRMQMEPPTITKPLADTSLKEKEPLELKIRFKGIPTPSITWFKDNIAISDVKTDEMTSTLSIDEIGKQHFGKYTCVATNVAGTAKTEGTITLTKSKAKFLKGLPRNEDLKPGQDLVLEVKVDGSPYPTITWYKDGIELSPDLLTNNGTRLEINNVKESDKGKYTCSLNDGEVESDCNVDVVKKKSKPEIVKPFGDLVGQEGGDILLECIVKSFALPAVKYFKDGKPIKSALVKTECLPIGDDCYKIMISFVGRKEDGGNYSIQCSNDKGLVEDSCQLVIEDAPIKPQFIHSPADVSTLPSYPILLQYEILSNPEPQLKLTLNNNVIQSTPTTSTENNKTKIVYKIDSPSFGLYKLEASNAVGTSLAETNIKQAEIGGDEQEPMFLSKLKSIEVNEGEDVQLKLKIGGVPLPSLKWFKDGVEVKGNVLFDGVFTTLVINDVGDGDQGVYRCEIRNDLGEDMTEGELVVKKVFEKPRFVEKFEDTQQVPTKDCKLTARLQGNPYPTIQWFKNNEPIKDSTKYKVESNNLLKSISLVVKNCNDGDIGEYKCLIRNRMGEDECKAKLDVRVGGGPREDPPSFLKKTTDTDLYEGMTGKFTACISGNPTPTYQWYKDNKLIKEEDSSKYKFEQDGMLLRLIIKSITNVDIGQYTLKIKNKLGESQCQSMLTIDSMQKTEKKEQSNYPLPLLTRPIISSMTDRYLTLSWKPSLQLDNGRYPITYIVEMCEGSDDDNENWFTVHKNLKHNICDIKNLKPGVDYKFRIKVENRYGISQPSPFAYTLRSKIYVPAELFTGQKYQDYKYEGTKQAPVFLNEIGEQYGIQGVSATLNWYLYGNPTPEVKFLFNGGPCFNHFTYSGCGELVLYINRMTADSVGKYEAIAWNEHGETRQTVKLMLSEHPRFIRRFDEKWIMLRDRGTIKAIVTGIPKPVFRFYKDYSLIGESTRMTLGERDLGDNTWEVWLELRETILKDGGLYSLSCSNICGTVTTSCTIHIEEDEQNYYWKNYNSKSLVSNRKPNYNYLHCSELGRGTQSIVNHVIEQSKGDSYAMKQMRTNDPLFYNWMRDELNISKDLNHKNIARLVDYYVSNDSSEMRLYNEYCGGGELLEIMKRDRTEYEIIKILREILTGIKYLHSRSIAHLSLTPRDIMFSQTGNEYYVKIIDFGLARIIKDREMLLYGQPEYVAPEVINKEGVGLEADMWSIGIISSLLLTGSNFYKCLNDMETMIRIQTTDWITTTQISTTAHDFITKLLKRDPASRLTVDEALNHPFLQYREESKSTISFKNSDYYADLHSWYANASCRDVYRRRPLEGAYTHSSRMVYPPYEDREKRYCEKIVETTLKRPNLEYELEGVTSESHYQQGPDTYLLQLRDADFPARLRRYMKVAASRSPSMALQLKATAIDTSHTIIRERRRFTDIMDEEVDDEKKSRLINYGPMNTEPRRLRHEVGPDTSHYFNEKLMEGNEGTGPILREKPEASLEFNLNETLEVSVVVGGEPEPIVQWFNYDLVISPSTRTTISTDNKISTLSFNRLLIYDTGLYKVVARNKNGSQTSRFKLLISDGFRATPKTSLSSLDYNIESNPIEQEELNLANTYPDLVVVAKRGSSYLCRSEIRKEVLQIVDKSYNVEKDLVKSLVHVNLLSLVRWHDLEETVFYIKEYSHSLVLDYLCRQEFYTEDVVCFIGGQVLDALNYIHWRGYILANLNPTNVVYDGKVAKLVDFTCAQRINSKGRNDLGEDWLIEFKAPEQLTTDILIQQTDIWSFGVLLYIMLSSTSPFKGKDIEETKQNIKYVRFMFEHLFKEISQEGTKFFIQLFKRSPLKRPTVEECFDSRWFSPSDFMQKKRDKCVFQGGYLKEYLEATHRLEPTSDKIEKTIRNIIK